MKDMKTWDKKLLNFEKRTGEENYEMSEWKTSQPRPRRGSDDRGKISQPRKEQKRKTGKGDER